MNSTNNYKCKVSVGFPVYNVEKYVKKSIESILDQDFDSYEILIIDDCGKDQSVQIIQNIVDNHPKGHIARIIHHDHNKGLAEARNTAIKNATGKYIYFVDSDDWITSNALSILYNNAEKYGAEVVIGSNYKQKGEDIWVEAVDRFPFKVFLKEGDFVSYLYSNITDIMPSTVWNILFNIDFLKKNDLLFPNIRFQEDIAFDGLYHPCLQKLVLLPDLTYYYLLRAESLMNVQARNSIDIIEVDRSIHLCELLKKQSKKWKGSSYYGGICAKTMRMCFFQATGILKHRDHFSENILDKEIRDIMKHPESILTILQFKQLKRYNIFYYILGILPPKLFIGVFSYICKKKGYLRIGLQTQI